MAQFRLKLQNKTDRPWLFDLGLHFGQWFYMGIPCVFWKQRWFLVQADVWSVVPGPLGPPWHFQKALREAFSDPKSIFLALQFSSLFRDPPFWDTFKIIAQNELDLGGLLTCFWGHFSERVDFQNTKGIAFKIQKKAFFLNCKGKCFL